MPIAEELYQIYPRHIGRSEALKSIRKALLRLPLELKLEGKVVPDYEDWLRKKTAEFAESPAGGRGVYVPYPSTWFNQSRYLDDTREWWLMTDKEVENVRLYREANVGVWRP